MSRNGNRKTGARRKTAFRILSMLEGRPIADSDISREEGGRPYFAHISENTPLDFNISHSGDIVAVSHVRGINCRVKLRTGCDIQLVKERVNTNLIAEQFFSAAENEYILTQKEQGNNSAFFQIWTLKECFIKLHGLSVFDMAGKGDTLSVPDFVNSDGSLNLSTDNTAFYLYKLNGDNGQQYILAACIKGEAISPLIQWFSESSLTVKKLL